MTDASQGGGAWPLAADINAHIFAGRRDITDPTQVPARLLTIGPGALRTALTLARGLPATSAQKTTVFCVDTDRISRDGLGAEANTLGVQLIHAAADHGPFDVVEAGAAIATANDPADTFGQVVRWLADDGGIGLCVPGAIGLTALGYARDAIDILAPPASSNEPERLSLLKHLLSDLPPTHWLCRGGIAPREAGKWAASRRLLGVPGRRLFTVAELIALAEAAGMRVTGFVPSAAYDPLQHVRDTLVRARIERLAPSARWIVAEFLRGGPWTHHCFLVRGAPAPAAPRVAAPTAEIVRRQYEAYPYPARDPTDDRGDVPIGSPSSIAEIDHYVFGGRRDWRAPFRALVAGGGTGDGAIMLARQLAAIACPADIIHLDVSSASQAVARARAQALGLNNLRFALGSLLDCADVAPGAYDYIDCCGVLHHLDQPLAGLRTLADALAPGGGIGVMVYGELGRTGVYHVAEILRRLAPADDQTLDPPARVAIARRLIADLPGSNWLSRNPFIRDHLDGGDAGIFDLLLHASDRPFRVPGLGHLVTDAGLRMTGLIAPALYRPEPAIRDRVIAAGIARLNKLDAAALAELLTGALKKHICYAVANANPIEPPRAGDPDAIPLWRDPRDAVWAAKLAAGATITLRREGVRMTLRVPRMMGEFAREIDGRRLASELIDTVHRGQAALDRDAVIRHWHDVYRVLSEFNLVLLRRRL